MNSAVEEETTPPPSEAKKEKKKFVPSERRRHLQKVITENKGKNMKLDRITKLASKSYAKKK